MPRCIITFTEPSCCSICLHHFSDASMNGYGTVSYLRVVTEDKKVHCSFMLAKERLTPIKSVSIPRLELMAACIAVQVDTFIRCETDFQCYNSVFWTDSTPVLQMIHNTSTRYPVFVANRLTKIEQGSDPTQRRCVDSKRNASDHVSRGLSATGILSASRWFKGPEFLYPEAENWPQAPIHLPDLPEEFLVLHRGKQKVSLVQVKCLSNLPERFRKFSS